MKLYRGVPQGTVQGVHADNMCATCAGEHKLQKVREQHPGDHGVQMGRRYLCHNHQLSKGTGGGPPNARGAGGRMGNPPNRQPKGKIQYWARNPEKKVRNPTKKKRMERMGRFWVDDT